MLPERITHALRLAALPLALTACGVMEDGEQFANKVTAPSFVAELYGSGDQTVTVNHATESHISWMGLVQSNDYKYFKITKVMNGGEVVVSDGAETGGEPYVANSNAVVRDVTVSADGGSEAGYADGSLSVGGDGELTVTVRYSPLKALASEDAPHTAYLIVYYDSPKAGALRIKLEGYTDGVKNEKCARDVSTMTPVVYGFKGGSFDFYFCGEEVAATGQNNIAGLDPSDAGYHGANTNLTPIPTLDGDGGDQHLVFYRVDEETACLLSRELAGGDPSIPDFTFVIPEGLAPIDELAIGLSEGSFAECALDGTGGILCDGTLLVDTGVVPVSPLTASNGAFAAEELTTTQCADFGALAGAGAFASGDFTLVLHGTMLSDANTQAYNIVDALVAAEIELECISGC